MCLCLPIGFAAAAVIPMNALRNGWLLFSSGTQQARQKQIARVIRHASANLQTCGAFATQRRLIASLQAS